MGVKGDKATADGTLAAELIVQKLSAIGGITSKKMFGGNGLFHEGKMFGIVDAKGGYFLKANESILSHFVNKGAEKHGKMPYYSIPAEIFENSDQLLAWAKKSIEISK